MQVWLSVAWMKSPGSMIRSRATLWQMPGETPSCAEKSCTPGVPLEAPLHVAQQPGSSARSGAIAATPSA